MFKLASCFFILLAIQIGNVSDLRASTCANAIDQTLKAKLDLSREQALWSQRVLASAQQLLHLNAPATSEAPAVTGSMRAAINIFKKVTEMADRLDALREGHNEAGFNNALLEFQELESALQEDLERISHEILPLSGRIKRTVVSYRVLLDDPSGYFVLDENEMAEPKHSYLEGLLSVLLKNIQMLHALGYSKFFTEELKRLESIGSGISNN